jgi:hypothetical protein
MSAVAKEKELYSGKVSGLTFEAFDEKVITWCRKKYGDAYAVGLWKNEMDDIYNLDLADEDDNLALNYSALKSTMSYAVHQSKVLTGYTLSRPSGRRSIKWSSGNHAASKSSAT